MVRSWSGPIRGASRILAANLLLTRLRLRSGAIPESMDTNPFESPRSGAWDAQRLPEPGQLAGRGYLQQISVISLLMLIQGGLLMIMFVTLLVYSLILGRIPAMVPLAERPRMQQQVPVELLWAATAGLLLLAGFLLLLALMHFLAGYWGLQLKGRMFSIVTLVLGLGAGLTLYCAPTAIGLAIYGMVVYFHPAAQQAFALRSLGLSKAEVEERFHP